eukprot:CAMPEP_0174377012 /NCGR_PEP_ID=MMETSP0811_2-20130205/120435_1 /TAXON_ID=73025 ORGANISM="Eutreptiella gymnastica-like, Strain CCMP1594" /NCGR_SAMPLE_ID=MMETSP0811_2 /ASSEMBLY_ACC=CAM_ASM_000667 /LENGTH=161 /DNA_ID=CAMNT_0015528823 /DNA_START=230 /DNA_END=712 /DNA_ORIENTATION=+
MLGSALTGALPGIAGYRQTPVGPEGRALRFYTGGARFKSYDWEVPLDRRRDPNTPVDRMVRGSQAGGLTPAVGESCSRVLASASPNRPALPRRGGGFVLLDGASPRVWSRAEGRKALGSARGGGADDAPQPPVVRRALCITVTRLYIRRAGVAGSSCEFWG